MAALRLGRCLLRLRREEADNMSQEELSRRLEALGVHISQTKISAIETGKRIMDALELKACSVVLKCDMEDLYEFTSR
ncbi:helix-turn-helix transcriptional regulator [Paenibacillus sp. P22]|uniref:helix-turn-helix transcriptional regulator n=1 Tax=Paenibacillus sp. P22 TaxID=483908 RepID=UPI00038F2B9E|nr:helix-turn-helix transcriptional regulator [Paenibacillus sp. P22]CDN41695.1 hypothetical protein BN871_AJ_00470 [Paenibacillus sp. P22]